MVVRGGALSQTFVCVTMWLIFDMIRMSREKNMMGSAQSHLAYLPNNAAYDVNDGVILDGTKLGLDNLEHLVLATVMLPEQYLAARLHRPVRSIDVEHHATMAHAPITDFSILIFRITFILQSTGRRYDQCTLC